MSSRCGRSPRSPAARTAAPRTRRRSQDIYASIDRAREVALRRAARSRASTSWRRTCSPPPRSRSRSESRCATALLPEGRMSFGAPGYLALPAARAASRRLLVAWWAVWRAPARARVRRAAARARRSSVVRSRPARCSPRLRSSAFAAARPQFGEREATRRAARHRSRDRARRLEQHARRRREPTRLGRAQTEIARAARPHEGDRAGLVIFAGAPFVRSPLTSDLPALRDIVDGVDEERGLVPPGSDLGAAIRGAQTLLDDGDSRNEGDADRLRRRGPRRAASPRPSRTRARRHPRLHRRRRHRRRARRCSTSTRSPARPRRASTRRAAPVSRGSTRRRCADRRRRRRPLRRAVRRRPPLAGLAAEFDGLAQHDVRTRADAAADRALPDLRGDRAGAARGRDCCCRCCAGRGDAARAPRGSGRSPARGSSSAAICSATRRRDQPPRQRRYARGDFDAALAQYRTARGDGASQRRAVPQRRQRARPQGDYAKAIDETKRALPRERRLAAQIAVRARQPLRRRARLSEALEAYKRALLADPGDDDAKHNLEVVIARLTPTPRRRRPRRRRRSATPTPSDSDRPPEGVAGRRPAPASGPPQPGATRTPGTPARRAHAGAARARARRSARRHRRGVHAEEAHPRARPARRDEPPRIESLAARRRSGDRCRTTNRESAVRSRSLRRACACQSPDCRYRVAALHGRESTHRTEARRP